MFVLIITAAFYTGSSASTTRKAARSNVPSSAPSTKSKALVKAAAGRNHKAGLATNLRAHNSSLIKSVELFSLLMPQAAPEEAVATYADDCNTPKSVFNLGETVCVKATNVPLRLADEVAPDGSAALRLINWSGAVGNVKQTLEATTASPVNSFVIPSTQTSVVDGVTIDNRGTWAVSLNSISDGLTQKIAYFTVKDPNNAAADLAIYNYSTNRSAPVAPGGNTSFFLHVSNIGPDDASAVHLTHATPANMTRTSITPGTSGAAFDCSDSTPELTDCTLTSMAKDEVATLTINYSISSGASNGIIASSAAISSATNDVHPDNNSSEAKVEINSGSAPPASCSLTCPANMTVSANTTQNGQPGAIVNFSGAGVSGDCGAVSNSPASGTFLPLGVNTVTSSSETGSSCTFTVNVVSSAAPTIACPGDITVTASGSADEATLPNGPGTPTYTASGGGTVTGVRSDSTPAVVDEDGTVITPATPRPLTDPYPAGTTGILWTVTDADGRTATCTQKITVISAACANDDEAPTITAPEDITVNTGAGNTACSVSLDDELGQPEAADNCSVNVTISGIPAGNNFAAGQSYTLTYTATDGSGNTAQDTQVVTVVDNTAPVIEAPADASYVCLSDVPAANASQATRGEVLDENGNPLPPGPPYENCGTATVQVTETASGVGNASSPKVITRTFTATDAAGNSASDTQTITVTDAEAPSITLNGAASMTVECSTSFDDPGATPSDNCADIAPVNVTGSVDVNTPGTYTLTYQATDAVGNQSPILTRTVTVVDTTPPSIALNGASSMTVECSTSFTDPGATASDSCSSTAPVTVTGSVDISEPGTYTLTYKATDASGNESQTLTRTVTVVDTTPPTVTPPANITVYLPLNSSATSMAVSYPNPATATDTCGGTTIAYSPASGSVFNVGTTTVTVTATDDHNNSATATFTVTVLYNFTGFFQPVGNLPTLNSVNAGRGIPVKFSLSGNKGLAIFATGSPYSVQYNCGTGTAIDLEETVTAGGSSLSYGSGDQYNYVWKTESSWAGTCRQLNVVLNDGSVHQANFKFK